MTVSREVSNEPAEPARAVRARERVSLILTLVPLAGILVFLLVTPAVWTSRLAVFFDQDRDAIRADPGWLLAGIALIAAVLCAWVGVLGTRDRWQHNRRWQRGVLGSVAATLAAVLLGGWVLSQQLLAGAVPQVSSVMFVTACAMLYGVVCAAVSPRDRIDTWYPEDEEREEDPPSPAPAS